MIHRIQQLHFYLKRRGIYTLAGKSIYKLFILVILIGLVIYFAETYISDFNQVLNSFLIKWDWKFVSALFFVSETLLGLIPPDFFIVWANSTAHPYLMTTVLAFISYFGAMLAYYIGYRLSLVPEVNKWLLKKFSSHFATFHKYGGFLIVFSALFPLPFSTITMVTGMLHYPFKRTALLGLTRILRFFGYGYVLSLLF